MFRLGMPSTTGGAVGVVITVAALITAAGIIWRGFIRPIVHAARAITTVVPVLLDIGREFKPDHGETLHDVIHGHTHKLDLIGEHLSRQDAQLEHLDARLALVEDSAHEIADVGHRVATRLDVRPSSARTRRTDQKGT